MPSGTRSHSAALALPSSAQAPRLCRLITLSPVWNCVTPGPTATTIAGRLAAGNERRLRAELVFAGQHQHIDVLHAARLDADLHLTGTGRRRIGHVAQCQHLRTAERLAHHRFHPCTIPCCRRRSIASSSARRHQHRSVFRKEQGESTNPCQAREFEQVGLRLDRRRRRRCATWRRPCTRAKSRWSLRPRAVHGRYGQVWRASSPQGSSCPWRLRSVRGLRQRAGTAVRQKR